MSVSGLTDTAEGHAEGSGFTGEMGWKESHEGQQGELQISERGEEKPKVSIYAGH